MNTDAIFEAVVEDHRLEGESNKVTEALARHRWHWTLDESNPDRINVSEYARRVGRSQKVIFTMVSGYNLYTLKGIELHEAIARAGVSAERTEVVEEVARATGKTFQNVVKNNAELAGQVHRAARDRAERKGTTVSDELPRAAQSVVASQKAAKAERVAKVASRGARLLAVEGHLANAHLSLRYALRDADGEFTEEEREFLASDLGRIRDLLNLLDVRITGQITDVDWDAELAKLGDK